MKNFALAGNPNCGKTTLFNSLTGSTAYVGNWPGVTVDKKEGIYKKGDEPLRIVDLPGIYSLSPYTSEEIVSRNYLLSDQVDCIINIIDVTNLERNLYLTTQLMEIDIPIVIALNIMDVFRKNGGNLNVQELEKRLGIPVIEISALKEENLDVLMTKAYQESLKKRFGKTVLKSTQLTHLIDDCKVQLQDRKVKHPLFHAIKLIELDELETDNYKQLIDRINAFKENFNDETFGNDLEAIIADSRYRYISENLSILKKKTKDLKEITLSDKIDQVLTNKWLGIPIFLILLFLIFHLTFSDNLFYMKSLFNKFDTSFKGSIFEGMIWTKNGLNSPGVMLTNFVSGITNWLSQLVASSLKTSPEWVSGLIVNGVLGGIFAVLSFLPQILCLFLLFSILEDSGYMSRIAFILDKILRKFGLSGRAFMPMIMGFGCSVPAMINTRTLSDENEKTATIRVIPFFSCGAKLPILTAIAGGIVQMSNINNADVITYSMYLLGMITAILSVLLMRNTTMRGETPPFIMELPSYHLPQFKSLMLHLWDKAKHFVKKAFTVILASTIIIWFLSHFSWSWKFLSDQYMNESILASIGKLLQPIFTPLGFGSQLNIIDSNGNAWGWVFIVAAITGLIAKENVIATFGTLAACITGTFIDIESAGGDVLAVTTMINATGISVGGLLAFIVFNMTTIPCFAAVATAKAELSKGKFKWTILFWLVISFILSSVVYFVIEYRWTILLFEFIFIVFVLSIIIYNKKFVKK